MKKYTLLLSSLLTVASLSAVSGQVFAAVATDGQSGTSKVTATLTAPADDKGSLKLTAVPDLDFGTKEITDQALTMDQTADGTVSVSDSRGTGAGYTVDVALTTPFTSGAHTLAGSTLTLKNANGTSQNNDGKTVSDTKDAVLTDTAAKNIITAGKDQGMGNWNYNISKSTLNVLSGAYAGKYEGQLTWTLKASPNA
ncbi:hypothetical protein CYK59_09695 [Latilactobacillus curvatus]|uniref:WxL domain-containing protein n=1 Tax=Latilactobacillus curvatus TaxID=28038 RepID=UPI000F7CF4FD|nr:WxL domain-containing protein [Latilactobacillus curvatus]AZP97198.1 hypothetical protein CYK59_09695 [Latilactobacillus curvatus]